MDTQGVDTLISRLEAKKTVIEEYRDATIVSESAVFRVYVKLDVK